MMRTQRQMAGIARGMGALVLAALVALVAGGCGRVPPYVPSVQVPRRAAVLNFALADALRDTAKEYRSWYFGAHDVYRNANVGSTAADAFHAALEALPYLELVSRFDLRYYIGARRDAIEDRFKGDGYTDPDFDRMVDAVSPVAIGRDLDVDYVITGRIADAYMARNRTVSWSWSRVTMTVEVWDCRTGQRIYTSDLSVRRQLSSPLPILRSVAVDELPNIDAALAKAIGSRRGGGRTAARR